MGCVILTFVTLFGTWFASPSFAQTQVVEMFTSKFCPNCPAAEKYLAKEAATNPDLLLLQQHVDYWDRGDKKDPFGLPEATQRQYDYSNTLSRRAGEVFTPMPILNGQTVAAPPLWLNWADGLKKSEALPTPTKLVVTRSPKGLSVALPQGKDLEAWAFGVTPMESTKVVANAWRASSIMPLQVMGSVATLSQALTPSGSIIVLVQAPNMGRVVGFGVVK